MLLEEGAAENDPARPPALVDLTLPARAASVSRARAAVREFATAHGMEGDELGSVLLAVSEAVTNAVVHAFVEREPGRVRLMVWPALDELIVCVSDDGRGMQPRPDSPGLRIGLATIGQVTRSLDIRPSATGGTEVRMAFAAPGVQGTPKPEPDRAGERAGAPAELTKIEGQLSAALDSLAEAVTIQSPSGELIYANHDAARLLGYDSPGALLATPARELFDRYEATHEDGSPLHHDELPGRRVLAGEEPEPLVTRVIDRSTGERRWQITRSSAVRDHGGGLTMVVNVIADITATKRAELAQRLLADAGEALGSSMDYERTLQAVAGLCVPGLADWCAVSLPDDRNFLRTVAVAHTDPDKVALARRAGERHPVSLDESWGSALVFRTGAPQLMNEIPDEVLVASAQDADQLELWRSVGMRAALVLPISSGSRTLGVLSLVQAESRRTFDAHDVALARELARRAGTAVENARLYTERSNIARTLQASLLPETLPELAGWRTATLYRPAGDENWVGGDFYEAIPLGGDWMVVVGDVTGRGAPAAALTALMRHTLRTAATLTGSPDRALQKLNGDLLAREALATAVVVRLRETPGACQAIVVCAGHPRPVLVRGGAAVHVGAFGTMLGAFEQEHWQPVTLDVQPGDVLVLYSDGVLDAIGAEDRFGSERLLMALQGVREAPEVIVRVRRALADFQVAPQADDTAVLALERLGP